MAPSLNRRKAGSAAISAEIPPCSARNRHSAVAGSEATPKGGIGMTSGATADTTTITAGRGTTDARSSRAVSSAR